MDREEQAKLIFEAMKQIFSSLDMEIYAGSAAIFIDDKATGQTLFVDCWE